MPYPSAFPSPQSSARETPWLSPTQSLALLVEETGEGEGKVAEAGKAGEVRAAGAEAKGDGSGCEGCGSR